jgi:hypothetical protein
MSGLTVAGLCRYLLQGWANYMEDARCAITHSSGGHAVCKVAPFPHLSASGHHLALFLTLTHAHPLSLSLPPSLSLTLQGYAFLTFVHVDYAKSFIETSGGKMEVRGREVRMWG